MNSQQLTVNVNVPDGYEIVRYDYANKGEMFIDSGLDSIITNKYFDKTIYKYFIVKKAFTTLSELKYGQKFMIYDEDDSIDTIGGVFTKSPFVNESHCDIDSCVIFAIQSETDFCYAFSKNMKVVVV